MMELALIKPSPGMKPYVVRGVRERRRGVPVDTNRGTPPFTATMLSMSALIIIWRNFLMFIQEELY